MFNFLQLLSVCCQCLWFCLNLFQAYQMRPSIIFFDEIDGLAPVRSSRQDQIHRLAFFFSFFFFLLFQIYSSRSEHDAGLFNGWNSDTHTRYSFKFLQSCVSLWGDITENTGLGGVLLQGYERWSNSVLFQFGLFAHKNRHIFLKQASTEADSLTD